MEEDKFTGEVVWFSAKKGYGFLSRENDEDIFVHYSDLAMDGFKVLRKGQVVTFRVGLNKRGDPKAIDVVVIRDKD